MKISSDNGGDSATTTPTHFNAKQVDISQELKLSDLEVSKTQIEMQPERTRRFKSRSFIRKSISFFKQANPIFNTWKYYMRLLPRWVRLFLIQFSVQFNLILLVTAFKFWVDSLTLLIEI